MTVNPQLILGYAPSGPLSVLQEVTDQWGGDRKKIRIRLSLAKQPWTGVQAQKEPAVAFLPSLSSHCDRQGAVQLRWFKAIWALGRHSPDPTDKACRMPLLHSSVGLHNLWPPSLGGFSTISLPLSQGSQENKLPPWLTFKSKGFLFIRTGGHSSGGPSFSYLSYLLSENSEQKEEEAKRKGKSSH